MSSAPHEYPLVAIPLPTLEDYKTTEDALGHAFAELERIGGRLRAAVDGTAEGQLDPRPTLADIGALFSFIYGVELQLHQQSEKLGEFRDYIRDIDAHRLDIAHRQRYDPATVFAEAARLRAEAKAKAR